MVHNLVTYLPTYTRYFFFAPRLLITAIIMQTLMPKKSYFIACFIGTRVCYLKFYVLELEY